MPSFFVFLWLSNRLSTSIREWYSLHSEALVCPAPSGRGLRVAVEEPAA